MPLNRPIALLLILILLAVTAAVTMGYGQQRTGYHLAMEYFDPQPIEGYGTQRALVPAVSVAQEASFLRQGIRHHQLGDYDLALVSLRAYHDERPVANDYLPGLLASTAAFATGHYEEAEEWLGGMERGSAEGQRAYLWYKALCALRSEDFDTARDHLRRLTGLPGNSYPTRELLAELP